MEVAVRRPQRWDVPLSGEMGDEDVARLLEIEPFRSIDPAAFPPTAPLADLLRNDCRILRASPGEILVRAGDYGSSAFFILAGKVRVLLSGLTDDQLGRPPQVRRSWWNAFVRTLRAPRLPEVRRRAPLRSRSSSEAQGVTRTRRADDGRPRIFLQDVPRVLEGGESVELGAGELFGELAALTRAPRSATVLAATDCVLLEIRWQGLRDLMKRTDALRRHVERLYRENSLRVHLRETPLLAELPPEPLERVAAATAFETHGEFDWHASFEAAVARRPGDALVDEPLIAEEGVAADGLLLIRSGFARVSQRLGDGHRTVAYLGRGATFGLAEAIESAASGRPQPWRQSLRALGYVDVLRIPLATLAEQVLPHLPKQAIDAGLASASHGAPPAPSETLSPPLASSLPGLRLPPAQSLLETLVDRRLINGTQAMVIDLDRCTRCDDCVRACAATHDNNPRFVRSGPRHGPLQFAHACMHCVDPVCMIGCPTGAIARDAATGVVRINDRTCIGCSTCANSCPYDNIRMVEIRDRRGTPLVDADHGLPLLQATKCDLCVEVPGGPACQRACPHDALVRIDLGETTALQRWRG